MTLRRLFHAAFGCPKGIGGFSTDTGVAGYYELPLDGAVTIRLQGCICGRLVRSG